MRFILAPDLKITSLISSIFPHNHFFNLFFSFFSLKGGSFFIWALIIVGLIIFEEKRDKKFIIYFLISFLTTAFLVNVVLKNIFMRSRPYSPAIKRSSERRANSEESSTEVSLGGLISTTCPTDYSFPSSHAATALASATTLAYFDKKRRRFYYIVAIIIAYSRIYLYCHYFGDVIFGGMIGYFTTRLILKFAKIRIK